MRTIPPALQAHLNSGATTVTWIMRIDPVDGRFPSVGCTMLDRDIVYDDGDGEITYSATLGMTPSTLKSTASMGVDNGEAQHLLPEGDMGISERQLASGAWDYASYRLYVVNYEDLSMGHAAISRGRLGQVRVENGLTFWTECTSLAKKLKVPVVAKSSRTCRAIFGSQPLGTVGADVTEKFPCGKDISGLWVPSTVTAVGLENTRTFTASGLSGNFFPGMVKWLTGNNVGRQMEVESFAAGAVSLAFELMYPIQIGDTFEIRPDCTKWKDGTNGCKHHFGDDWVLHYRGEPDLRPEDSSTALVPGIAVSQGV